LKSCSFRANRFTDAALAELTTGRIKPKLEVLDISFGRYTDSGLVKLSRSELFPNLRELHLGYSIYRHRENVSFGTFGIEALLNSTQIRFDRIIISIHSESPVPRDMVKLAEQARDRVVLDYRNPRAESGF